MAPKDFLKRIFIDGVGLDSATALSQATGGGLVERESGPSDEVCGLHRLVVDPDGRFIDILGFMPQMSCAQIEAWLDQAAAATCGL